jgi:hypothetical protein
VSSVAWRARLGGGLACAPMHGEPGRVDGAWAHGLPHMAYLAGPGGEDLCSYRPTWHRTVQRVHGSC